MPPKPSRKSGSASKSAEALRHKVARLERELDIEAALERVRAASLAIHDSSELQTVVNTLFEQMNRLGIPMSSASIFILEEGSKDWKQWVATATTSYSTLFHIPYRNFLILKDFEEARQAGTRFYVGRYNRRQKNSFLKYGFSHTEYRRVPKARQRYLLESDRLILSFALEKHIALCLATYEGEPFSEEINEMLRRFAKVFEQAYTRFLDLQKAEALARKAQIETALERIRARALAMHSSDDLHNVTIVLREQMALLGQPELEACVIELYEIDDTFFESWYSGRPASKGKLVTGKVRFAKNACAVFREMLKKYHSAEKEYTIEASRKKIEEFYEVWKKAEPEISEFVPVGDAIPQKMYYNCCDFSGGTLLLSSLYEPTLEVRKLQAQVASVFDLAYRRFKDLQKAEAQAREAQIEAALERVRAASMAMHGSSELQKVVNTLFQQLKTLGIPINSANIFILQAGRKDWQHWAATNTTSYSTSFAVKLDTRFKVLRDFWEAREQGLDFYTAFYNRRQKNSWFRHAFANTEYRQVPKVRQRYLLESDRMIFSTAIQKHIALQLAKYEGDAFTTEENSTLKRFSKVFEQAYTRFLDLQKAEAQTREAQIEAALERVRSSMMAMHKTEELHQVLSALMAQLQVLGFPYGGAAIIIYDQDLAAEHWMTGFSGDYPESYKIPYVEHPYFTDLLHAWQKGVPFQEFYFEGDLKIEYAKWAIEYSDFKRMPPEFKKEMLNPVRMVVSDAFNAYGMLEFVGAESLTEDAKSILKRFSKVFEQAYTRFLDLQKAEAQAREAEIQLALERVRARTMAMQHSHELGETSYLLFEQFRKLGKTSDQMSIGVFSEDEQYMEVYLTLSGAQWKEPLRVRIADSKVIHDVYQAWKMERKSLVVDISGKALREYNKFRSNVLSSVKNNEQRWVLHVAFFSRGMIIFSGATPEADETVQLLVRFTEVFNQTYTRFLDLQRAETQAREAQIEAALERVRAKTMAMHNTEDIAGTVTTFFNELLGLGLDASIRCGIGILSQADHMKLWTASVRDSYETILHSGTLDMSRHPLFRGARDAWAGGEKAFSYTLEGRDVKHYFQVLNDAPDYPVQFDLNALPKAVYHNSFVFRDGILYAFTNAPMQDDIRPVLERFAALFGQTYTRYLDLQKAEQRAREAIKQASIERVRGEIASMRSAADLNRITPLIWNELTTLGVPFFRCGVFIVDEQAEEIHSYLSNPQGESLAVWHAGFNLIPLFDSMVASWKKQEVFKTEWDRQDFLDFSKTLMDRGLVDNRERYQSGADAPEHLVLHMVPFAQGMLYVGSQIQLEPSHMELVRALADAFSVAYARYEDFRQLEKTLAELKAAQAQLIQSEKMASLGELTAGIAHEIKNPLNFVNNFSEVSRELLDELIEELEKGELEEVRALARDVSENLEKIVHHGTRADSIVKGMLQHSRSGDGKKEPTDLNALADEYLRLAYHGLRAKDKSFNAAMASDFDPSLGQVQVIPQDMGRVLLNLLTNAFHAVQERKQREPEGYEPTVWVKTRKSGDGVEIEVQDNGGGIPAAIKKKIFQPFFTTKPTGQGTGLGLSLSYDIVKAHGGEIVVTSTEGKGTEFTIKLPAS